MTTKVLRSLHPMDVAMASTRFYSSLPVVGKHLEPFAGLTAMMMYGGHYAPTALLERIDPPFSGAKRAIC